MKNVVTILAGLLIVTASAFAGSDVGVRGGFVSPVNYGGGVGNGWVIENSDPSVKNEGHVGNGWVVGSPSAIAQKSVRSGIYLESSVGNG